MAESGARVTAFDFSQNFIAIAKSKSTNNVDYHVIDATNETDFNKLKSSTFDSIVCTMAMMDMENIEVLIRHSAKLLKKNGVFVFSILHPCFNSGENALIHERDDSGGELKDKYYVKIRNYLIENSYLGVGMAGQPKPQYYFHRPISSILKCFFQNGFVLEAFEEPSFINIENSPSIFDNVFKHIPPALICRLKLTDNVFNDKGKEINR
jgi:SAM-dependent methyltransferase